MNTLAVSPMSSMPLMPPAIDVTAAADRAPPRDARAVDSAATGFESLFASMLLKEMRRTLQEGSLFGDDKGDVLGGLFDHFLGEHLAQAGALGIGAMVKNQWLARGDYGQQANPPTARR
jgi:peptidoglycan hydrolase FlgJ